MRLINCTTLQLEEFFDKNIPRYAILSHTWGDGEVSFADLTLGQAVATKKEGYQKILFTCHQALQDGVNYAWVDTCCIDKCSSSELSEAINSMFGWYRDAYTCYAYLSDVTKRSFENDLPVCRWFTRGWTLQELLAPSDAMFYDRNWEELGTKLEHANRISEITIIDVEALTVSTTGHCIEAKLGSFCVAKRMSWASRRKTSRVEDMAYCLLGIFGINMPLLYGEGQRAFVRIQEEIMKNLDDDSILAWGLDAKTRHPLGLVPDFVTAEMEKVLSVSSIMASSPRDFGSCGGLEYAAERDSTFKLTNCGLQIQLPLVPIFASPSRDFLNPPQCSGWVGLLSCSAGTNSGLVGIVLFAVGVPGSKKRVGRAHIWSGEEPCHTVVVGPRAAAQSVLEKVIVIREEESLRTRGYLLGYRQIIVNQSQAFLDTGYYVTSGTGFNIAENRQLLGYSTVWDSKAMVLTIEDQRISKDLLSFCFGPRRNILGSNFTVFMRTASKRALLGKGSSFSEEDKHKFYDYLEGQRQKDDTDEMTITDSERNSFQVTVFIREKRVYNRQIFEVNIDAV